MEQSNYQIEFLSVALHDMTEIISSFIMLGSKNGAINIKDKMNKTAKQIAAFPYSGVIVPDEKLGKSGYRMVIVGKYLMFYRIFEDEHKVVFYRVLNGARYYPTLLHKFDLDAEE